MSRDDYSHLPGWNVISNRLTELQNVSQNHAAFNPPQSVQRMLEAIDQYVFMCPDISMRGPQLQEAVKNHLLQFYVLPFQYRWASWFPNSPLMGASATPAGPPLGVTPAFQAPSQGGMWALTPAGYPPQAAGTWAAPTWQGIPVGIPVGMSPSMPTWHPGTVYPPVQAVAQPFPVYSAAPAGFSFPAQMATPSTGYMPQPVGNSLNSLQPPLFGMAAPPVGYPMPNSSLTPHPQLTAENATPGQVNFPSSSTTQTPNASNLGPTPANPNQTNQDSPVFISGSQQGQSSSTRALNGNGNSVSGHGHPSTIRDGDAVSVSSVSGSNQAAAGNSAVRYDLVPQFDIQGSTFEEAIDKFNNSWKCNDSRAQLVRDTDRRARNNTRGHRERFFVHSCGQEDCASIRFTEQPTGQPHLFKYCASVIRQDKELALLHFSRVNQAVSPQQNLPVAVTRYVTELLTNDPLADPQQILIKIIGDESHGPINDWVLSTLQSDRSNLQLLVNYIESQADYFARTSSNMPSSSNIVFDGTGATLTTSSVRQFAAKYSIYRYESNAAPSGTFGSLQHFMDHYGFNDPKQLLTVPITADCFRGSLFTPEQIEVACSSIVITTPTHLWTIIQLEASETQGHIKLAMADGIFKLFRAGSRNTVMIALGSVDLDVHDHGNQPVVSRKFLPYGHCIAQSEHSAATFALVCCIGKAAEVFGGINFQLHRFISDESGGLRAGIMAKHPQVILGNDPEHVVAKPTNHWKDMISSRSLQSRLANDLTMLWKNARSKIHFSNSLQLLIEKWRAMGEDTIATHMERQKSNWNFHYTALQLIGFPPETQALERYLLALRGVPKLNRPGILTPDLGLKSFIQQGIPSLLEHDEKLLSSVMVGRMSQRMHERSIPLQILAVALLMSTEDFRPSSRYGHPMVLANAPTRIGQSIVETNVTTYIAELTESREPNSYSGSFKGFLDRVSGFCELTPVQVLLENPSHPLASWATHLHGLNFMYICRCEMFCRELCCPAQIFLEDRHGRLQPNIASLISPAFTGRATGVSRAGRRRVRRPAPMPSNVSLLDALGLPHGHRSPELEFLYSLKPGTIDKALKLRGFPAARHSGKVDRLIKFIAGTKVGRQAMEAAQQHAHGRQPEFAGVHESMRDPVRNAASLDHDIPESEYTAFFNPFPEGKDPVTPELCQSYWLSAANSLVVERLSIFCFVVAMSYHMPQGNGFLFLKPSHLCNMGLTGQISSFCSRAQYVNQGPEYLVGKLHQAFLIPGTSVQKVNYSISGANRDQRTSSVIEKMQLVVAQLQVIREIVASAVLVLGGISMVILRSEPMFIDPPEGGDFEFEFRVIIPRQIRFYIGSVAHEGGTFTIVSGKLALGAFLGRLAKVFCLAVHSGASRPSFTVFYYQHNDTVEWEEIQAIVDDDEDLGPSIEDIVDSNLQLFNAGGNPNEEEPPQDNGQDQENAAPAPAPDAAPPAPDGQDPPQAGPSNRANDVNRPNEAAAAGPVAPPQAPADQDPPQANPANRANQAEVPEAAHRNQEPVQPRAQAVDPGRHFQNNNPRGPAGAHNLAAAAGNPANSSSTSSTSSHSASTNMSEVFARASARARAANRERYDESDDSSETSDEEDNGGVENAIVAQVPQQIEVPLGPEGGAAFYRYVEEVLPEEDDVSISEEQQQEMGYEELPFCCICSSNVVPFQNHLQSEFCEHAMHKRCAVEWFQSRVRDGNVNAEFFYHDLIPFGLCPLCRECRIWRTSDTNKIFPHGTQVFGTHKCKDPFDRSELYTNYIADEDLWYALHRHLNVPNNGAWPTNVNRITVGVSAAWMEEYMRANNGNFTCQECNLEKRLDHRAYLPECGRECGYCICIHCFERLLPMREADESSRNQGKTTCPTCSTRGRYVDHRGTYIVNIRRSNRNRV